MLRSVKFASLGLCIVAFAIMWLPQQWIDVLRDDPWRMGYSIALLLIIFILPAFFAVFDSTQVRPGPKKDKRESSHPHS